MTETSPSAPVRIAAIQTVSGPDVAANLETAARLIGEAAAAGARLVALPEYFPLISKDEVAKVRIREPEGGGPLQDFLAGEARRHGVWLIGGTIPLLAEADDKVRNSTSQCARPVVQVKAAGSTIRSTSPMARKSSGKRRS